MNVVAWIGYVILILLKDAQINRQTKEIRTCDQIFGSTGTPKHVAKTNQKRRDTKLVSCKCSETENRIG